MYVYECILDKELIGPNFRRKMKPLLIEVNDVTKEIEKCECIKLDLSNINLNDKKTLFVFLTVKI